mmetsp:Transcript_59046/g.149928  ORF Transcript_59046/g.149928 Transcript_59046/m.149928 type:complete len:208 (+) Transcript_59046:263-886(+)
MGITFLNLLRGCEQSCGTTLLASKSGDDRCNLCHDRGSRWQRGAATNAPLAPRAARSACACLPTSLPHRPCGEQASARGSHALLDRRRAPPAASPCAPHLRPRTRPEAGTRRAAACGPSRWASWSRRRVRARAWPWQGGRGRRRGAGLSPHRHPPPAHLPPRHAVKAAEPSGNRCRPRSRKSGPPTSEAGWHRKGPPNICGRRPAAC